MVFGNELVNFRDMPLIAATAIVVAMYLKQNPTHETNSRIIHQMEDDLIGTEDHMTAKEIKKILRKEKVLVKRILTPKEIEAQKFYSQILNNSRDSETMCICQDLKCNNRWYKKDRRATYCNECEKNQETKSRTCRTSTCWTSCIIS